MDVTPTTEDDDAGPITEPPAVGPDHSISLWLTEPQIPTGSSVIVKAVSSAYFPVFISAGPSDICAYDNEVIWGFRPGVCTVTAESSGNDEFYPATQSLTTRVVGKIPSTIYIDAPSLMEDNTSATITVRSTAPGAVIQTTVRGDCELRGSELFALVNGGCTVIASHPETEGWRAATRQIFIRIQGRFDEADNVDLRP